MDFKQIILVFAFQSELRQGRFGAFGNSLPPLCDVVLPVPWKSLPLVGTVELKVVDASVTMCEVEEDEGDEVAWDNLLAGCCWWLFELILLEFASGKKF